MLEHSIVLSPLLSRPSCSLDNHSIRRSDTRPSAGAVERNGCTLHRSDECNSIPRGYRIFIPVAYMARLTSPLRRPPQTLFIHASGFSEKLLCIPNQTGSQFVERFVPSPRLLALNPPLHLHPCNFLRNPPGRGPAAGPFIESICQTPEQTFIIPAPPPLINNSKPARNYQPPAGPFGHR